MHGVCSAPRKCVIERIECAAVRSGFAWLGCWEEPGSPAARPWPSADASHPPELTVTPIVTGLDHPWDIGFAGNTMLFTERPGRISAFVGGQKRLLAAPTDVVQASEAGMMGLAVDPAFATNRYIYTCFASTLGGPNNDVRLVRWTVDANFTALTNRTDIVTGLPVNAAGELGRHSGCRPRFDSQARLWWEPAMRPREPFRRTRTRSAARCSGSTATERAWPATPAARSIRASGRTATATSRASPSGRATGSA